MDQEPLFWNFTHAKAIRLLELQQIKKRGYAHLDVPDTGELTEGPGGVMNEKLEKNENDQPAQKNKKNDIIPSNTPNQPKGKEEKCKDDKTPSG